MFFVWQKVFWHIVVLQGSRVYAFASLPAHNTSSDHVFFANNTGETPQTDSASPHPSFTTSEVESSQTTSSSSAHGMGDFIAMGLGMSDTRNLPSTDMADIATPRNSSSSSKDSVSYHSSHSSNGFLSEIETQQNASDIKAHPTTSPGIKMTNQTGAANSSTTASGYIPVGTELPVWENRSLTLSGDCWNQWNQFWSAEEWSSEVATYWSSRPGTTLTSTTTQGHFLSTSTVLSYYTTTVFNGRFPVTTYSTLAPVTDYDWVEGTPTTTWVDVETVEPFEFYTLTRPTTSLQSPSCVLPSIVPQCQQSWDALVNQRKKRQMWVEEDGPPGCNVYATTEIPWSCQTAISSWKSASASSRAAELAPKCSQAKVPEDYCSSARSHLLFKGEIKGFYFPDAKSTATTVSGTPTSVMVWPSAATVGGPGCTIGCGYCAMQGETVELIYWPPATSFANETATIGPVGLQTVVTLGTTLTSPTVYISFDTLWAKNSCSNIGRTITKTIVAITKTEDMSSLWGYELSATNQMSASFNFTDLYHDPTPDEIYERQPRCWRSSMAAKRGRHRPMPSDYAGCAHTEPYEPILVIPMEVRALDPAWAECKGGIEGVYDPPLALRPTDKLVVPTNSESHSITSSAAPASSPSPIPAPTTTKGQSPSIQSTKSTGLAVQDGTPATSSEVEIQAPQETQKTTRKSGDNVWPPPPISFDVPETTNALSILKSAQASAQAAQAAASLIAEAAKHQSESFDQSGAGSARRPEDSDGSLNHAPTGQSVQVWTQEGETFTAVLTDGMAKIQGAGASMTITAGNMETFKGQEISVSPDGSRVEVDGAVLSLDPIEVVADPGKADDQAPVTFEASSQTFTAVMHGSSVILQAAGATTTIAYGHEAVFAGQTVSLASTGRSVINVNGEVVNLERGSNDPEEANKQAHAIFEASDQIFTVMMHDSSLVLQAAGATTTIAYGDEAMFAGQTMSLPSSGKNVINVNGERVTMQALQGSSSAMVPSPTVWIQDGETFTARIESGSTIVLEASGSARTLTPGSTITLADQIFSVPSSGGVLIHDGTSLTLRQIAATKLAEGAASLDHSSGTVTALDAGSSVIVAMGDKTFTLADGAQTRVDGRLISAQSAGGAIVVDGTATIELSTHPSTTKPHPPETGNAEGTEEGNTAAPDPSSVAPAMSLSKRAAKMLMIFGVLTAALR